jgi:carnitine O-acetyltransferase
MLSNMARILTSRTAPRRRLFPSSTNKLQSSVRSTLPYRSTSLSTTTSTTSDLEEQQKDTAVAMRPWRTPVVESHGDYRQEAWLEDYVGGGGGGSNKGKSPLYQYQQKLPRLPVPDISATLERFLPTALPLAKTKQEAVALQAAIDKFPQQSEQLQERLLARAASSECRDSSWLQHWWNTTGYLQVRAPVVVNVSYFFQFANDSSAVTSIHRAAAMLTAVADYRAQVATGQLPPDMVGKNKTPLCSAAYKYMLNACRIPAVDQDVVRLYDPAVFRHAVVARHGYFFAVPLVESTGRALPLQVLEGYLEECKARADDMHRQAASGAHDAHDLPPQLGWLTSSNRDDWARARQTLCQDPATKEALGLLESGAVLMCLDDEEPVSRQECGQLFCFGGNVVGENGADGADKGIVKQGANRWFDKSIQLFCTNNGKAGLMGEHSMMDGMPVVGLANRITELTYDKCQQAEAANRRGGGVSVSDAGRGVVSIFDNVHRTPQIDALVEKGAWKENQ